MSRDDSDDDQQRLQEFGDLDAGAPPVEEAPPACDRCGDRLDAGEKNSLPRTAGVAEMKTGFVDIREFDDEPRFCSGCEDLVTYLENRYRHYTAKPNVTGAIAIYCGCHGDEEVDVRPVHIAEGRPQPECSRCGSREVVVEELPPARDTWRVKQ